MRKTVIVLLTLFLLLPFIYGGCGGGGGGGEDKMVELCLWEVDTFSKDNPPPLDSDNMLDTYTLIDFVINIYVDGENVGWLDGDDFTSFSGILDLQESTIKATITLEGETVTIGGPYTRTIESPTSGFLHIDDASESYDVRYSFPFWCHESVCATMLQIMSTEPECEMIPESELN